VYTILFLSFTIHAEGDECKLLISICRPTCVVLVSRPRHQGLLYIETRRKSLDLGPESFSKVTTTILDGCKPLCDDSRMLRMQDSAVYMNTC